MDDAWCVRLVSEMEKCVKVYAFAISKVFFDALSTCANVFVFFYAFSTLTHVGVGGITATSVMVLFIHNSTQ